MYTFTHLWCIVVELYYFFQKGVATPQNQVPPPPPLNLFSSLDMSQMPNLFGFMQTISTWAGTLGIKWRLEYVEKGNFTVKRF